MGRKRAAPSDLPERVHLNRGSYFYVCRLDGKQEWFLLGQDRQRAVQRGEALNAARSAAREHLLKHTKRLPDFLERVAGFDGELRCAYCGTTRDLGLDHVVPTSRGGSHRLFNLVLACGPCNASKGKGSPLPLMAKLRGHLPDLDQQISAFLFGKTPLN